MTQPTPQQPKKASQSLTVRASIAKAVIPALAAIVAKYWADLDTETALLIAGAIFAVLQSVVEFGMRRAQGLASILFVVVLVSGCCAQVDHKKLGTFPTIRKSLEGIRENVRALKVKDKQDEELKALTIEEAEAGIELCKQAEAR